ncbi:MAG: efflux RND transporter periplasmic adaptor subunit [Gammaproteobacteria bacterium]|nr:efflux RND transporter periplasmic adaptor subunit [Gammaproteobacteria bacterium]
MKMNQYSLLNKQYLSFAYKAKVVINSIISIVLVIILFVSLSACSKEEEVKEAIRPVLTQAVKIQDNWQEATYAGEVKARYKMNLGFRIGGKIVERYVEIGDIVEPGTLLAKLDPDDSKLQLVQADGALQAAKAEKRKAELDMKRYTKLYKQKMVSATEHLRFSNTLDIAKARYIQAQAHLEVTRNQSDYTHLYADKGGVVTSLEMEVGQVVVPGQTMVNLALPEEKEVVIAVAESRLDEVRHADDVKISLWIDPKKFYRGKVREISPGADPVTRTYTVKISLFDIDDKVQLGMTTTVLIVKKNNEKVAKLPLTSLFQKNSKPAVWIYSSKTSQVHLQAVEVSEYQFDSVLIQSGLKNGDQVVTAGVHKLYEGQRVRLQQKAQW